MNRKIVILVCVVACSVTIQALNLQQVAGVLGVEVDQLNDCLKENHFSDEDATDIKGLLRDAAFSPVKTEERRKNFSCFVSCAFEKANITKNNEIQLDGVIRIAERNNHTTNAETTEKLKDCIDTAKDEADKCRAALSFSTCYLQQISQEHGPW